jgi:fibronectin-binding autotransporter adhesin
MKPTLALRSILLGSTLLAATPSLHATPYYWNTTTTSSWTDDTKWSDNATSGGTTGTVPGSGDTAVFNQSSVNGAEIITLSGATSIGGITFKNTGTTTIRSVDAATKVLTIGAGGITMASGTAQSEVSITGASNLVSVALDASQEWKNQSNAILFVRSGGSLGAHTLTLTTTGSGLLSFGGNVSGSGNVIVSTNSLAAMAGGGSTYSGTTTIHSGAVLTINALTNSGSAGSLGVKASNVASNLVIDGGTLKVQVSTGISDRLFTMGAGGATFEATNTGANSGQIQLTNTAAITYSGVGNRNLTLTGASDDAGGSSIALDIDDVGGGNGIVSLVKNGTHAWTASGATNSYSGGTTVNTGTLTMGSASALGSTSGQLTVNTGGTLNMGSQNLTVGNLTGTGGTISGTSGARLLTIGEGNGTGGNFQGAINDGAGGTTALTKTGNGTITLSGTNGYTGDTHVNEGTLIINGNTSSTSLVTVANGATLGGSGTVGGATTVNGYLKPGTSTGLLTVGSLDLNANASTILEVNGLDRGALADGYDAVGINPGGSIDLAGALSFAFGNLSAFANNSEFDLFSFTTTSTGDFASVTSSGFYAGTWSKTGDIWSLSDAGQTLNFSEATGNLTVIPEPRATLLGGLGMFALLRRRRN